MRFARIVSFVFHPLLLTTYLVLAFGYWAPSMLVVRNDFFVQFSAFIFAITFLLPALNIIVFRQLGVIDSIYLVSRKERIIPFVFNAVLYVLIACLFVYQLHMSTNFTKIMMVVAALAVNATLCTFFFKVSVHALSWAGSLGMLLPLNRTTAGELLIPTLLFLIVAGVVMSARLKLNAHTPQEVLAGGLSGFAIGFAGIVILF